MTSSDLRIYVVWVPVMDGDDLEAARVAAARLSDPRASHFWDEGGRFARAMGSVLALPGRAPGETGIAWDVFLLYGRGVGWRVPAPEPTFWYQQLMGADPGRAPFFDGEAMRERVVRELAVEGRAGTAGGGAHRQC